MEVVASGSNGLGYYIVVIWVATLTLDTCLSFHRELGSLRHGLGIERAETAIPVPVWLGDRKQTQRK